MRRPVTIGAATLVTFALGALLAVLVAGSASAASSATTKNKATTAKATTTKAAKTTTTTAAAPPLSTETTPTTPATPADQFLVVNGTVNAASDHEILASSAFPNYTTGAVDNYYSLAHAHVDNSPFAQGTASPFDTGPIGQTAAAGNTQQPQYADARWPGSSGKAEYGNQGGPHAVATAGEYKAAADASLATNALSGPSATNGIVLPKGLDGRLRAAIAAWKAKWQVRLGAKPPTPAPTPTPPKLPAAPPKPAVTTPVATVTTPAVGGVNVPAPTPVQAPSPAPSVPTPTVPTPTASAPPRSLASDSKPTDGESLLVSSTSAGLVPDPSPPKPKKPAPAPVPTAPAKTGPTAPAVPPKPEPKPYMLVTSGESSLGRVSLGGGQIVIEKIHVTASIANDGTPTYKAAVSVGSASIGGIPVTIDESGVHVAGQGQALPYKQASDALNNALKQAGIQLFLVGPEVTTCSPSGGASGGGTGTTTTTTTSTTPSNDQPGGADTTGGCGQSAGGGTCDQTGSGGGTAPTPAPTTTTTTSTTTTTPGSCGQATTCDQMGTGTTTTTTTTTTTAATPAPTTTTSRTDTTPTSASCDPGMTTAGAATCSPIGTTPGTIDAGTPPATTGTMGPGNPLSFDFGASNAGEMTVTATGVHVVFTQPVNQSGVPSQHIEHILGDVFVDSLVTPLDDTAADLDLSAAAAAGASPAASGTCLGGVKSSKKTATGGGLRAGGGSSTGGSASTGSLSPSASGYGSAGQPVSGSSPAGTSLPVAFASALRKPVWLLLAYLVWQALVIGTGISLWHWRRGDAS